jgi:transmembrane sensor
MTSPRKIEPHDLEEAADWLLRLRDSSVDVSTDFLAWLESNPAHRLAFDSIDDAWTLAGHLKFAPAPANDATPSADHAAPRRRSRRFGMSARYLAIAASVVVLLGATFAGISNFGSVSQSHVERIVTGRSQHQTAVLPDGSRVDLGGASAVSVRFSNESRTIVVDSGETYYEVKKDPGRPFVVQAGPVTVTAVGTKFTVRRDGEAVSVIVTEGVVEVSADPSLRAMPTGETRTRGLVLRAAAGERVRYDRGELAQTVEHLRSDIATSWRFGRLEFVDEPLRLVVAGVSRYSSREIIIDDPAIAELRFTGTVFENQIPSWLKAVESVFDVKVVELDSRRILITRRVPNQGTRK